MSDLISRQTAIDAIRASTSKYTGFMEMEMYTDNDAVEAINGVPSADRPQGKWKAKSFHEFFCDNCGFSFDMMKCDFLENMNFCPNCGAYMRGETNE